MPTATVNAAELYYERRGVGEPLLLIQGMSGTHLSWGEPFLAALERAGFDTLAYDHRGIGRSARWREPFTIAELAADAAGLLEAVGWSSAHVLGISMGGMVAQELALAHPERAAHARPRLHLRRRPGGDADRPHRAARDQPGDAQRRP